jgi:hypothetical protein
MANQNNHPLSNFVRMLSGENNPNDPNGQNTPYPSTISGLLANPLPYINPSYTQQQPYDALAPLKMLQQYKQTGSAPNVPGLYQPYNSPSMPVTLQPGAPVDSTPVSSGGK